MNALVKNPVASRIDYGSFYQTLHDRIAVARTKLGPLTLTDKILAAHCTDFGNQTWNRGSAMLGLTVDRVVMQDATAQMALLQLMNTSLKHVAVPASVHCDHLIAAFQNARADLDTANVKNAEVYEFLRTAASRFGIDFWAPGSGIIHQVALENYASPGGLMIGTDSHTPNAGGLGMLSIGVGGAEASQVMTGMPLDLLHPKVIGVRLTGTLSGFSAPKDVITHLCALLTVKGGTNCVIEYFGPGVRTISATGRATICNMGAELGATGSIFPMDENAAAYLEATGHHELAKLALEFRGDLTADPETELHPERYYDRIVDINLGDIVPYIVGPHSPDLGRSVAALAQEARTKGWPLTIKACLIGSCTNSSFGDMMRVAAMLKQGLDAGLSLKVPLLITPGSERVLKTLERAGIIDAFKAAGAHVHANACGPCIGMWKRSDVNQGEANTIVSSFNRNFPGRNDENKATLSFLTSPEMVVAYAFAGTLDFNPLTDALVGPGGSEFRFVPPAPEPFPVDGIVESRDGFAAPSDHPEAVEVIIRPDSDRIQRLAPFPAWDGQDFRSLRILAKLSGKTTTDSISPAGRWLDYRGHLPKISQNLLMGGVNAFTGETGKGTNPLTGEAGQSFASIAGALSAAGEHFVIVGGPNYGEGSSREHAAMSPRFFGCAMVIVQSFARIHETNLKLQGVLPLWFVNPDDYDAIGENDRITVTNLAGLAPSTMIMVKVERPGGSVVEVMAKHTLTAEQITWFKAGSALNTRS